MHGNACESILRETHVQYMDSMYITEIHTERPYGMTSAPTGPNPNRLEGWTPSGKNRWRCNGKVPRGLITDPSGS